MSVTSAIDRVVPFASGWSRTGTRSILALFEQAQDELLEAGGHVQRYVDPTDNKGFPPYLLTTAGTYKYEITGTNLSCGALVRNLGGTNYTVYCKHVIQVFRDVSKGDYGTLRWVGKPFVYYNQNPYSSATTRLVVAQVPVNSYPRLENTAAYIEFLEDPGTSTETYFVEFQWEAPRLSSESIPLCIPLMYERALEDYAIGRIQQLSNGAPNAYMDRFEKEWKPRFISQVLTRGASQNSREVQPRTC